LAPKKGLLFHSGFVKISLQLLGLGSSPPGFFDLASVYDRINIVKTIVYIDGQNFLYKAAEVLASKRFAVAPI